MPAASWPESCIPESLGTLQRPKEQVGKGPRTGRGRGVDKVQRQTASVLRTALSPGTAPHHHPESPGRQGSVGRGGTGEQQREPCQTQGKNKQQRTGQETETCWSPAERKKSPNPISAGDLQQNTHSAEWGGGWPRAQGAWYRVLGTYPSFLSLTVRVCKRGKARNCDSGTMMGSRPDKTQVRSPSCTLHQNTV